MSLVSPVAWLRPLIVCTALLATGACDDEAPGGARPSSLRRLTVDGPRELSEMSAAVITHSQPDIVFTINDSGHEADLFAFDTTGRSRGMWHVMNAGNVDWEAAASGPCAPGVETSASADSATFPGACLTIADVGDNGARRASVVLYRVSEPRAMAAGDTATLVARRLEFRYADGPHDVEAMVVGPRGDTFLVTKRRLASPDGRRRPALVFTIPAAAWAQEHGATAMLVDSLPIVPGSARGRLITDAALSPDGHYLAVRTYTEVYILHADTLTGRPRPGLPMTQCDIASVERGYGEGIAWIGGQRELLLTQEGRHMPAFIVACPVPTLEPPA